MTSKEPMPPMPRAPSAPHAGPGPGPAPTADTGTATPLGAARRRVLEALEAAPRGLTVTELAGQLGGHANAGRHHLTALAAEGLVVSSPERPEGRGRPARVYRPTPAGHRALKAPAAVGNRDLVAALVSVAVPHPDLVREAGLRWGRRIAGQAPTPTEDSVRAELARVMTEQGFAAADSGSDEGPAGTGGPAGADGEAGKGIQAIELRTCPLLEQARQDPASVCAIHAGMLQGVVQAWGSAAEVGLEPFALPHGCRVTVRVPHGDA